MAEPKSLWNWMSSILDESRLKSSKMACWSNDSDIDLPPRAIIATHQRSGKAKSSVLKKKNDDCVADANRAVMSRGQTEMTTWFSNGRWSNHKEDQTSRYLDHCEWPS